MTDNTKFKEHAAKLLGNLIHFQRNYLPHTNKNQSTFNKAEGELRAMLEIARTDEENAQQRKEDSYC